MRDKASLIILAGHGCGLGSLYCYMGCINLQCAYIGEREQPLLAFLKAGAPRRKAVIVDRCAFDDTQLISTLMENTAMEAPLIIVTRDPLSQLLSFCNEHIWEFAHACSGAYATPVAATVTHSVGGIANTLKSCLLTKYYFPQVMLGDKFSARHRKIIFMDVSAIFPENVIGTLGRIHECVFDSGTTIKELPRAKMFTRTNRFASMAKKLPITYGGRQYALYLVPEIFLSAMPLLKPRVVATFEREELNFTWGDFEGPLAIVLDKSTDAETVRKIGELARENRMTHDYCADLMQRHNLALQIYDALSMDQGRLFSLLSDNPDMRADFLRIMDLYYTFIRKYEIYNIMDNNGIKQESLDFIDKVAALHWRCARANASKKVLTTENEK